MNLAERLSQRSGLPLGAHTMAEHLQAIVARWSLPVVAPYTMAAVLIAYSGLPAGQHTVAEHLAVERAVAVFGADDDFSRTLELQRSRIRQQNDLILQTVIAAVMGGMIE